MQISNVIFSSYTRWISITFWAYQCVCNYLSFCFSMYTSLIIFFKNFYQICYFFKNFQKMCVQTFGLSPWIKSIGILELFFWVYYESFPFRKCNKIENRTDGASSNIKAFTLKLPICRIVVPGPFPLQPYYSRVGM